MTHEEAVTLLPSYALGALDADVAALEAHLSDCDRCAALLASYLETTAALAEAVPQVGPPASLRAVVLTHTPGRRSSLWETIAINPLSLWEMVRVRALPSSPNPGPDRDENALTRSPAASPRGTGESTPLSWRARRGAGGEVRPLWETLKLRALPLAAALLLVVGLAAGNVVQQQQLRAAQSEIALDQLGLALLTSTETTVERLNPIANPAGPEHGHWYHREGIATQVVVVEFMPAPASGLAYFGWLQHADGSWQPVGRFTLNDQGYGRIILTGSDGADVRAVVVTRQAQASAAPTGQVVLRWAG